MVHSACRCTTHAGITCEVVWQLRKGLPGAAAVAVDESQHDGSREAKRKLAKARAHEAREDVHKKAYAVLEVEELLAEDGHHRALDHAHELGRTRRASRAAPCAF